MEKEQRTAEGGNRRYAIDSEASLFCAHSFLWGWVENQACHWIQFSKSGNQENQEMKKKIRNQVIRKIRKKTQGIRIRKSGNFLIFIFQNQIHKISKHSTC
jgi:single-stranded DNA-specific DHH superfamily exonuclease